MKLLSADNPHGVQGLLTRAQVARRLGIGVSSVRRLEGHALHPVVGIDGVHRFAPDEVEAHRAALGTPRTAGRKTRAKGITGADHSGKQHSRAFRLFEAGRSHAEVVIEAGLPSPVVRQLHAEWRAGYRQPEFEPPLVEDDAETIRERDEAAWAEWEKKMQALSSEMDPEAPAPAREVVRRRALRWSRRSSRRL